MTQAQTYGDFGQSLYDFRTKEGFTQREMVAFLNSCDIKITERTYSDYESKKRTPRLSQANKILSAIQKYSGKKDISGNSIINSVVENYLNPRSPELKKSAEKDLSNICHMLMLIAEKAVFMAATAATIVHHNPHLLLSTKVKTNENKATKDLLTDKTEPQDLAASIYMDLVLAKEVEKNPLLRQGVRVFNEEMGYRNFIVDNHDLANSFTNIIEGLHILCDPLDGSHRYIRGYSGASSICSFYHEKLGYLAVAIADISGRKIYLKQRGSASSCYSFYYDADPSKFALRPIDEFKLVRGPIVPIQPRKQKDLFNSFINVYRYSKKREDLAYQKFIGKLKINEAPKFMFNNPGALGCCDCNNIDAAVEFLGYRPWDVVGAYIAAGSGCTVINLKGEPIDFESSQFIDLQDLDNEFKGESLDNCRTKFILANSEELAEQVLSIVNRKG